MGERKLDSFFKPSRIAVIGAGENPRSVGSTILRNLIGGGFRGVVYPVHPTREAVLGVSCHASLRDLPRTPDLAVLCTAATEVPKLVRECGECGVGGVIVVSAGFGEAGDEGRALEAAVRAELGRFPALRLLGPNCLGVIVPGLGLNASFAAGMPRPGHVAFISQSGALCTSVLDWALEENIGFSHFVSIGNTLDLDFGDLIDYFGESDECESILLYMESLKKARPFLSAARAFARTKPIVVYKAGRFAESARAAGSHTGALAGEDAVFDAAFERAGAIRVHDIGEIFAVAELVARHPRPRGKRLGIVTNAGGPGVMAVDALVAAGGSPAELAPETLSALDESLPPSWSRGNPVDVLGDAPPKRYAKAVETVLADPGVDAVLAILTPQAMTNPTQTAKHLGELASATRKPVLAAWVGGRSMREGVDLLNRAGVATYDTPEHGVRAFMTLVRYAHNLETLYEVPRDVPVSFTVDRANERTRLAPLLAGGATVLTEVETKSLLEAYGIPTTTAVEAASAGEAAAKARDLGFPVVLKVLSRDILHKSDVGGVALGLRSEREVEDAYEEITARARAARPDARIDGVAVQPMAEAGSGVEILLGARRDPLFGPVIVVGAGGVATEVYRDRALGFPPLNERLARRMLESLRIRPLLEGFRGRPGVDLDALIATLIRFSYLVADFPEIREIDVNPVLARPRGLTALDARAFLDPAIRFDPAHPWTHLALRPYPEEYVRPTVLRDGTPVTLRPIRPEDEPRWIEMLRSCSRETIYARFRGLIQWDNHRTAVRYCYIDYDREIAIVAESGDGEHRRLMGVGRLVADPDLEAADFAVLVADPWQNHGLGGLLTGVCVDIAREWGVKRILAETATGNIRMRRVFERQGFGMSVGEDGDAVIAEKDLVPVGSEA